MHSSYFKGCTHFALWLEVLHSLNSICTLITNSTPKECTQFGTPHSFCTSSFRFHFLQWIVIKTSEWWPYVATDFIAHSIVFLDISLLLLLFLRSCYFCHLATSFVRFQQAAADSFFFPRMIQGVVLLSQLASCCYWASGAERYVPRTPASPSVSTVRLCYANWSHLHYCWQK